MRAAAGVRFTSGVSITVLFHSRGFDNVCAHYYQCETSTVCLVDGNAHCENRMNTE